MVDLHVEVILNWMHHSMRAPMKVKVQHVCRQPEPPPEPEPPQQERAAREALLFGSAAGGSDEDIC
jgi:hypothetical protein